MKRRTVEHINFTR